MGRSRRLRLFPSIAQAWQSPYGSKWRARVHNMQFMATGLILGHFDCLLTRAVTFVPMREKQLQKIFLGFVQGRYLHIFLVFLWMSIVIRPMKGNPGQSWILDSTWWIADTRYWIPVFVSETWILGFIRCWDSGFFELYSRFQSPGFQISQAKFSRIPDSKKQKFLAFRNPDPLHYGAKSSHPSGWIGYKQV